MNPETKYVINTDIKFGALEKIDIGAIEKACDYNWFNQTLCKVNDSLVRLGILKGEFHWHKHADEDEFFYVVAGTLTIDLEGLTVELLPQQGYTIPKGVVHRTSAAERAVILMIEGRDVKPTGD